MLIEFNVGNYRSFWERQSLKMTAGSKPELRDTNTFKSGVSGVPDLLRSAVVYGPNAAGKSNLVNAMKFVEEFVLTSAKDSQEGEKINLQPFLFNEQGRDMACEFEILFIQDGVRFQYGFGATQERVTEEWLFAYPAGRPQRWFVREIDPETEKENWAFSTKFTGPKKLWQEATRKNALFLSTAIQLNCEQLKPVFSWFQRLEVIEHGMYLHPGFSIDQCMNDEGKEMILAFMNTADLSIQDIHIDTRLFSEKDLPSDMPQAVREVIKKEMAEKKYLKVKFLHPIHKTNRAVWLPIEEESDGTRKLFAYAAPCLDLLNRGCILFVDEFDNNLHSIIIVFLLGLLNNSKSNKKNGQVVFTTHNTSFLDQKLLRRDQVWFVEKNEQNATDLYPLSDFNPRKGEALQKGYLQGRYGALPYIGRYHGV
jgi:AAA15 family ATPase/GTPase